MIEPTRRCLAAPRACTLAALALFTFSLRRLRSLMSNDLGPEAGMALAEALKSNTTLKTLVSAALPSNPPAHALRPHSMHARCTGPLHAFSFAVCAASK